MAHTLHTLGYELADFDDFAATLSAAGVSCVLDVRAVPLSRKPGFSKNKLRRLLESAGIDYLHVAALGDPKTGRQAARAGRYQEFRRIYGAHLKSVGAIESLRLVALVARKTTACLLCYERDPSACHRSIVAEMVSRMSNLRIEHLVVEKGAAVDLHHDLRRGAHSRKGHAAAQPEVW